MTEQERQRDMFNTIYALYRMAGADRDRYIDAIEKTAAKKLATAPKKIKDAFIGFATEFYDRCREREGELWP